MRLRIRFSKTGKVRFVGHRDVARIMERALRRVGVPVTYSEGFSPRLKMSFGLALPTCYESGAEYLDVPLESESVEHQTIACVGWAKGERRNEQQMQIALSEALPEGFEVIALRVEPSGGVSLQESVMSCGWEFDIRGIKPSQVEEKVEQVLSSTTVEVERKKKNELVRENIRAGIMHLSVEGESERGVIIATELAAKPRVIRPSELLSALAPNSEIGVARRTHQWIEQDGQRVEPLLLSN